MDDSGKRLVLFGRHAGFAGMIDGLHGLGLRLLARGYNSPFMYVGMSHTFRSLAAAKLSMQQVGNAISEGGIPHEFGPMTFVFTGTGNVSQGAQEVFSHLPHEYIQPQDLPDLISGRMHHRDDQIYACQVAEEHHIVGIDGRPYTREEYRAHPEKFTSMFSTKIAPYTSMLINGVFWNSNYPRLLTRADMKRIQSDPACTNRMISIADISCDVEGSLEFMDIVTTIEKPFFYHDAIHGSNHYDIEGPGVQILSVDNLPTELPLEASNHFSQAFYPFAVELLQGNYAHPVLNRAAICHDGKLTQPYSHLNTKLPSVAISSIDKKRTALPKKKNVLLLGSGMVASPLVEYLLRSKDFHVTVGLFFSHTPFLIVPIASNVMSDAQKLIAGKEHAQAVQLDIHDANALLSLIHNADAVVSFVPAPFHPIVAEACIEAKKHMVTASYISPAMRDLNQKYALHAKFS